MRQKIFPWVLVTAVIATTVSQQGCRTARQVAAKYPRADIESIYADSLPNPNRNPVVLVHGFGGSLLQRADDGATVWGAFFTEDALLPSKNPGLTAFALDVAALDSPPGFEDLLAIEDDTQAVELLQKVTAEPGPVDINFGIYASLVDLMESSGYSTCQSDPAAIEDLEQPPCLTFFYDWRQDNVGSAIRLGRFLEAARARIDELRASEGGDRRAGTRFDLIAHSMGGLVARYYLRYGARDVLGEESPVVTWEGGNVLDRLIVISTPSFGSMRVLRQMVYGRSFSVVDFEPAMILTWPSAYQMLPRSDHALWLDEEGGPVEIDILSTSLWQTHGWGPFDPKQDKYLAWIFPEQSTAEGARRRMAAFMDVAFERTRRFQQVMDSHAEAPCPTELTLFAADIQPTPARAQVVEKSGRLVLRFDDVKGLVLRAPGDGSVTRASAVADERLAGASEGFVSSPIPWHRQVFLTDMHRTFLGNTTFQNNLLHILLETPPRRVGRT